jgi:hypothetical protein
LWISLGVYGFLLLPPTKPIKLAVSTFYYNQFAIIGMTNNALPNNTPFTDPPNSQFLTRASASKKAARGRLFIQFIGAT